MVLAEELAQMPTYYIMDLHQDMAATVAPEMPSAEAIAVCRWLPDASLVRSGLVASIKYPSGMGRKRNSTTEETNE